MNNKLYALLISIVISLSVIKLDSMENPGYPKKNSLHILEGHIAPTEPEGIIIDGIKCHKIDSTFFSDKLFTTIRRLDIANCSAENITQGTFSMMPQLKYLWIYNNKNLQNIASNSCSSLVNLKTFVLRSNQLNFLHPSILQNLKKLKTLISSDNHLTGLFPSTFENNIELETLNLSSNNLTTLAPDLLKNNKKLRILFLSHNKLNYLNSSFFEQPNLEYLYLDHNKFEILNYQSFSKLKKLKLLCTSGNKLSDNQIKKLKSQLPRRTKIRA